MKKKLIPFAICLLVLSMLILPVSAKSSQVLDLASVMSAEDASALDSRLPSLQNSHGLTVVILTVPNILDQSIQDFADNFYDNNRYDENGILLMVDMNSSQYYISTSGTAIEILSDRDLMQIEEAILPYFSEGRFYDGFSHFLDILPLYLGVEPDTGSDFGLALLIGFVIALVILLIMRSSMNTKRAQRSAASYEVEGSYQLRRHQDLFLYSQVHKQPKPQNSSSGNSTHQSASGRSHGGRGGKF